MVLVVVMVSRAISSPSARSFYYGGPILFTNIRTFRPGVWKNSGNMAAPWATEGVESRTGRPAFLVGSAKFLIARKIRSIVIGVMSG